MFADLNDDSVKDGLAQVIALQEHKAESSEELNLSPGDVVQLTTEPVDGM